MRPMSASRRAAMAALALLVCGCSSGKAEYATAVVEIGDIRDVIPAQGRIEASREVSVTPALAGRVAEVFVEANESVVAGQPLARLAAEANDLELAAAAAEVEGAEAALKIAAARADESVRLLANRRLLSERGFYSNTGLASAQSQVAVDAAAVEQAKATVRAVRARSDLIRRTAGALTIRAPINGIVLARDVEVGQWVSGSEDKPMFQIAGDLSELRMKASIAEPDIGRFSSDLAVAFRVDAFPTDQFTGQIIQIGQRPDIDGAFVSYPVTIAVHNRDGRLKPGMTAATEFVRTDIRHVLRIPIAALYFVPEDYSYEPPSQLLADLTARGLTAPRHRNAAEMGVLFALGKRRVFVEKNGRWSRREILVGGQSREFVEIIDGLSAGERVIVRDLSAPADAA